MTVPDDLARQRCFNHQHREAAVRCPACRRFFCRECVTEHDDRMLCAGCLDRKADSGKNPKRLLGGAVRVAAGLLGLFLLWLAFHYLGQALLWLPETFHEGTLWKSQ